MKIGGYLLPWNPAKFSLPRAEKDCAHQRTHGGVGYFSWGAILPGVTVLLEWEFLSAEQFAALQAIYLLDEGVVWEVGPEAPDKNFNAQIVSFDGAYFDVVGCDAPWRKNVKMELMIRSVYP